LIIILSPRIQTITDNAPQLFDKSGKKKEKEEALHKEM
jgi:hypothetical protein